jgi:hypothetical protein
MNLKEDSKTILALIKKLKIVLVFKYMKIKSIIICTKLKISEKLIMYNYFIED